MPRLRGEGDPWIGATHDAHGPAWGRWGVESGVREGRLVAGAAGEAGLSGKAGFPERCKAPAPLPTALLAPLLDHHPGQRQQAADQLVSRRPEAAH